MWTHFKVCQRFPSSQPRHTLRKSWEQHPEGPSISPLGHGNTNSMTLGLEGC